MLCSNLYVKNFPDKFPFEITKINSVLQMYDEKLSEIQTYRSMYKLSITIHLDLFCLYLHKMLKIYI